MAARSLRRTHVEGMLHVDMGWRGCRGSAGGWRWRVAGARRSGGVTEALTVDPDSAAALVFAKPTTRVDQAGVCKRCIWARGRLWRFPRPRWRRCCHVGASPMRFTRRAAHQPGSPHRRETRGAAAARASPRRTGRVASDCADRAPDRHGCGRIPLCPLCGFAPPRSGSDAARRLASAQPDGARSHVRTPGIKLSEQIRPWRGRDLVRPATRRGRTAN